MAIIIMDSIHYILKAEKILKNNGLNVDLIPVPKEIHSNCGNAIEIEDNLINKVRQLLTEKNFNFQIYVYNKELDFYLELGGYNESFKN